MVVEAFAQLLVAGQQQFLYALAEIVRPISVEVLDALRHGARQQAEHEVHEHQAEGNIERSGHGPPQGPIDNTDGAGQAVAVASPATSLSVDGLWRKFLSRVESFFGGYLAVSEDAL
jgi:hypothetical protein